MEEVGMKREVARMLKESAEVAAIMLSNTRPGNPMGEKFNVQYVEVLSEDTAAVVMKKKRGKQTAVFFYFRETWDDGKGKWYHFPPTDSQILGMAEFGKIKARVEKDNYHCNFSDVEILK